MSQPQRAPVVPFRVPWNVLGVLLLCAVILACLGGAAYGCFRLQQHVSAPLPVTTWHECFTITAVSVPSLDGPPRLGEFIGPDTVYAAGGRYPSYAPTIAAGGTDDIATYVALLGERWCGQVTRTGTDSTDAATLP